MRYVPSAHHLGYLATLLFFNSAVGQGQPSREELAKDPRCS